MPDTFCIYPWKSLEISARGEARVCCKYDNQATRHLLPPTVYEHTVDELLLAAGEEFDAGLLRRFMLFTNDLDVSRGQSFRETHGELFALLREAGFTWTDETMHAGSRKRVLGLPLIRPGKEKQQG